MTRYFFLRLAEDARDPATVHACRADLARALSPFGAVATGVPPRPEAARGWDLAATLEAHDEAEAAVEAAEAALGDRALVLKSWVFSME